MKRSTTDEEYRYTLLLRNVEERVINGTASTRDEAATCRLARSLLRQLDGRVAYVDIYAFAAHAADVEHLKPIQRISLDEEEAEG